ncbi:fimbrial protein [Enterobacter bugandensis]|uniref:fimbrial protein n=1 Tax=Enterobacter bugandensis TaxID=881260 RepID=UPI000B4A13B2|nr:fimbrial protein [Enterobacter bugandensis]QWZ48823.1 fimbrial protein [Enterobacter bugandensis]UBH41106.1 fimbrial protein [Enterobacter bugandensis]UBH92795.1 fimbrial protein [Enterobacter bugandensis]UBH99417.1 fimbrial protein [Enterobacter bugandensis]
MHIIRLFTFAALVTCFSQFAYADGSSATIKVMVNISIPPCTINNGQTIDVDFGDSIYTTDVAKGIYSVPVNYSLDCQGMEADKTLQMTISGTGEDFDSSYLKTSMPGLGIKLIANGVDFPLNSKLDFKTATDKPELVAVLVKDPAQDLSTGEFTAGATMEVSYQ